jgi:hypothetical protein
MKRPVSKTLNTIRHLKRITLWSLPLFMLLGGHAAIGQSELPKEQPVSADAMVQSIGWLLNEMAETILNDAVLPELPSDSSVTLESLIEKALQQNPGVVLAQTEVRRAQAHLQQMKLETIREITVNYSSLRSLRYDAEALRERLKKDRLRMHELVPLQRTLRELEAQQKYLLGQGSEEDTITEANVVMETKKVLVSSPRPALSEEQKKQLQINMSVEFEDIAIDKFCAFLQETYGFNFVADRALEKEALSAQINDETLENILRVVTDLLPEACVVCRDYGFLLTTKENAESINAPTIPEEVPFYRDAFPAAGLDNSSQEMEIVALANLAKLKHGLSQSARRPVPEEMRKRLDEKVSVELEQVPLSELFSLLNETHNLNLVADPELDLSISIRYFKAEDWTMKGVLSAVSDSAPDLAFVVRDYGVFATTKTNAKHIQGPTIPENVPYLGEALFD